MKLGTFTKQPGEKISNSINYADSLDDGDEISTVLSCIADPPDIVVSPALVSENRVRVWASGGSDGTAYKITLTVETVGGEIFEDELICKVKAI